MNTSKETASELFWETHYARSAPPTVSPKPNEAFVTAIDEHSAGVEQARALELGSGRGGDALWLASRGWAVTAVDASGTAVDRLNELAGPGSIDGSVQAVQADLSTDLPPGTFDLVFGCYFQSPVAIDRNAIIHRAAQQIRRGGLLVIIDHASTAPWSWDQGAAHPTAEQTHDAMGLRRGWDPVTVAARTRTAVSPADGVTRATVTDNVVVLRREA